MSRKESVHEEHHSTNDGDHSGRSDVADDPQQRSNSGSFDQNREDVGLGVVEEECLVRGAIEAVLLLGVEALVVGLWYAQERPKRGQKQHERDRLRDLNYDVSNARCCSLRYVLLPSHKAAFLLRPRTP